MEWAQGVYPFLSVVRGWFPSWGEVLDRLGYQWCFPVFVVSPVRVCPIGFEVSFVFCVFLPFEPAPVSTHCQGVMIVVCLCILCTPVGSPQRFPVSFGTKASP